jgi:hypothetical protein
MTPHLKARLIDACLNGLLALGAGLLVAMLFAFFTIPFLAVAALLKWIFT